MSRVIIMITSLFYFQTDHFPETFVTHVCGWMKTILQRKVGTVLPQRHERVIAGCCKCLIPVFAARAGRTDLLTYFWLTDSWLNNLLSPFVPGGSWAVPPGLWFNYRLNIAAPGIQRNGRLSQNHFYDHQTQLKQQTMQKQVNRFHKKM